MGKKKRTTSTQRGATVGSDIPFLAAQQREMSKNEVKQLINQIGLICNAGQHQKNQKSLRKQVPKVQSGSSTRRQSASRDTSLVDMNKTKKVPLLPLKEKVLPALLPQHQMQEEEKKEEAKGKPVFNEDLAQMTERGRILGQKSLTKTSVKQEYTMETQQTVQAFQTEDPIEEQEELTERVSQHSVESSESDEEGETVKKKHKRMRSKKSKVKMQKIPGQRGYYNQNQKMAISLYQDPFYQSNTSQNQNGSNSKTHNSVKKQSTKSKGLEKKKDLQSRSQYKTTPSKQLTNQDLYVNLIQNQLPLDYGDRNKKQLLKTSQLALIQSQYNNQMQMRGGAMSDSIEPTPPKLDTRDCHGIIANQTSVSPQPNQRKKVKQNQLMHQEREEEKEEDEAEFERQNEDLEDVYQVKLQSGLNSERKQTTRRQNTSPALTQDKGRRESMNSTIKLLKYNAHIDHESQENVLEVDLEFQERQEINGQESLLEMEEAAQRPMTSQLGTSSSRRAQEMRTPEIDKKRGQKVKHHEAQKQSLQDNTVVKRLTQQQQTTQATSHAISKMGHQRIFVQLADQEPHYKRAAQKIGWIETKQPQFNIRFDISDTQQMYNKLKQSQLYNHFPRNRELTTKAGLCKNMLNHQIYELQTETYFPRCFDLSEQKDLDMFAQEFKQTAILGIFKTFVSIFTQEEEQRGQLNYWYAKFLKKSEFQKKKEYKNRLREEVNQAKQVKDLEVPNQIIQLMQRYVKALIQRQENKKGEVKLNSKLEKQLSEKDQELLFEFSQQQERQNWARVPLFSRKDTSYDLCPLYTQLLFFHYDLKLQNLFPQYNLVDGPKNVWIVKPSYNARGVGVYCTNALKDIVQQGKKTQSKIVQKYIERPLLVEGRRKFDIRQWVLVTSWEPLDLYIFSGAYLKLCGSSFELTDLGDCLKHLSNYTLQKHNKERSQDELIMNIQQFEEHIKKTGLQDSFSWEKDLLPKLSKAIKGTFTAVQESQENKTNCFEVYGLDIILDEKLNPWVIEVNLSPACKERASWLSKLLDDMSYDLMAYLQMKLLVSSEEWNGELKEERQKILQEGIQVTSLIQPWQRLNLPSFYQSEEGKNLDNHWLSISDLDIATRLSLVSSHQPLQLNQKLNLEVAGQKISGKGEKKYDKAYKQLQSVPVIQRQWKGYQGRKESLRLKQESVSFLIQGRLRMILAKEKVYLMKKEKASLYIQSILRQRKAFQVVQLLKEQRDQKLRDKVALGIQSLFRMQKAKALKQELLRHKSAIMIQKYLKGELSREQTRIKIQNHLRLVYLQKYIKSRHKQKVKASIQIQKQLRRVNQSKKVQILLKVKNAFGITTNLYQKKAFAQGLQSFQNNQASIVAQSYLRKALAIKKIEEFKTLKQNLKLKKFLRKSFRQNLKELAYDYRQKRLQSTILCQKMFKSIIAKKRVEKRRMIKLRWRSAIVIQNYLRKMEACEIVYMRKLIVKSCIKIQTAYRAYLAFKRVKVLKFKKERMMQKKAKEAAKKAEKDKKNKMEDFIENLLAKEMRTPKEALQRPQTGKKSTKSSTAIPAKIMQTQDANIVEPELQKNAPKSAVFSDQEIQMEEQNQRSSKLQQKDLRIRKTTNGSTKPNKAQNVAQLSKEQVRTSQASRAQTVTTTNKSQRTHKALPTSKKQQSTLQAYGGLSSHQQSVNPQSSIKPKNFSENLMEILTNQHIGQAFSENPVEALSILNKSAQEIKQKKPKIYDGDERTRHQQRQQIEFNELDEMASKTQNSQFQVKKQSFIQERQDAGLKQQVHFPKLQEFKAATNQIYIARQPAEVKLEPLKDESYLNNQPSNSNKSSLLHKSNENGNSFKNLQEQTQKYKYFGQEPLQRPGFMDKQTGNLKVVEAYKNTKAWHYQDHFDPKKQGAGGKKQKRKQHVDTDTKLVILK